MQLKAVAVPGSIASCGAAKADLLKLLLKHADRVPKSAAAMDSMRNLTKALFEEAMQEKSKEARDATSALLVQCIRVTGPEIAKSTFSAMDFRAASVRSDMEAALKKCLQIAAEAAQAQAQLHAAALASPQQAPMGGASSMPLPPQQQFGAPPAMPALPAMPPAANRSGKVIAGGTGSGTPHHRNSLGNDAAPAQTAAVPAATMQAPPVPGSASARALPPGYITADMAANAVAAWNASIGTPTGRSQSRAQGGKQIKSPSSIDSGDVTMTTGPAAAAATQGATQRPVAGGRVIPGQRKPAYDSKTMPASLASTIAATLQANGAPPRQGASMGGPSFVQQQQQQHQQSAMVGGAYDLRAGPVDAEMLRLKDVRARSLASLRQRIVSDISPKECEAVMLDVGRDWSFSKLLMEGLAADLCTEPKQVAFEAKMARGARRLADLFLQEAKAGCPEGPGSRFACATDLAVRHAAVMIASEKTTLSRAGLVRDHSTTFSMFSHWAFSVESLTHVFSVFLIFFVHTGSS